jgi:nucleotide-binding universal stress UspA family protein
VEPYPIYVKMRFPTISARDMLEEGATKMRAQLTEMTQRPDMARFKIETDVHIGKPFVELISVCRDWRGDVIVVGASSRGEERFLGSTGERVLRKSPTPVLIAKQDLAIGPKTVLIPTDFSTFARGAAQEALALVRGFGGRAVFLHVLDLQYIYPTAYGADAVLIPPVGPDDIEPDWQEFLQDLPLDGLLWEKQTREGRAAQVVADTAVEVGADSIVTSVRMAVQGFCTCCWAAWPSRSLQGAVRCSPCAQGRFSFQFCENGIHCGKRRAVNS